MQIAIDGPSGAGKSTIAKELAKKLNINYLDTGSMYRAIAYKLKDFDLNNHLEIEDILDNTKLEIIDNSIFLDGVNIDSEIRDESISKLASEVSKFPMVRNYLLNLQRNIGKEKDIIMDGRDIGTVVLPDADYKFFLTADLNTRAQRRFNQLIEMGQKPNLDEIIVHMEKRDYDDIHRDISPLKKADDAYEIDCTNLSIKDTIDLIISLMSDEDVL